MPTTIRKAKAADAAECGRIIHAAFAAIAAQHNFPPDFPSAEVATGISSMLIAHPDFYAIVAENDGRILGSNFLDERSPIGGIGPITIDPSVQNKGVGRQLMQAVMERAATKNMLGIRLVQDSFHNRSLCLYARLGFTTREPLSVLQGPALKVQLAGYDVRPATEADLAACNAVSAVCMASIAAPNLKMPSHKRALGWSNILNVSPAMPPTSATLPTQLPRTTKA